MISLNEHDVFFRRFLAYRETFFSFRNVDKINEDSKLPLFLLFCIYLIAIP